MSQGVGRGLHEIAGDHLAHPEAATLTDADIWIALRKGREDFFALRTDVIFVIIMYPIIGIVLATVALQRDLLPLLFPLMSGFAILGPVAAVGLYEMSRRRERGEPAGLGAAFGALTSPAIGAILAIGFGLLLLFIAWILAAWTIYALTLGPEPPVSATGFFAEVFTTGAGWALILVGCGVGFVFAAVTLVVTVVSIPLLLDRHVGVPMAIHTSVAVSRKNPVTVAKWGLLVAVLLVLGTIPVFLGLIVVFPILGHATWHLYRRAVRHPEAV
ncbi:DUF2189 domain-containing protein [Roseivivax sp. CAU 1761]